MRGRVGLCVVEGMTSGRLPGLLLGWYDDNARVLPWRSQPTPYRVWLSEIMLQQTRVEAVLPYFERFLAELPDIAALAAAEEARLMKLWQGLGYYSRARNLQKTAQMVMDRHGGQLPASFQALRALPGIGDYTAGAIASIAFGLSEPAVDGNVLRVLSRILASGEDIALPEVKKRITMFVREILPVDRPGDFNQALMDLGATVCLPNGAPLCGKCPLAGLCMAHSLGIAETLPVKAAKKPRDVRQITVFVIRCGEAVLLAKRPGKGLLAGLWELPNAEGWLDAAKAMDLLKQWSAQPGAIKPLEEAKHVFTHVEWRMRGYMVDTQCFTPPWEHAWADGPALRRGYAVPSAFKAYMKYTDE